MLNWSGAGLFDRDGKLLGVGSLIVRDANDEEPKVPGNMFVPIDLLKPILADLVKAGRRAGPARPWLGVAADEVSGGSSSRACRPTVPPTAPASRPATSSSASAGDSVRTQAEFYRKVWARGGAGDCDSAQAAAGCRTSRKCRSCRSTASSTSSARRRTDDAVATGAARSSRAHGAQPRVDQRRQRLGRELGRDRAQSARTQPLAQLARLRDLAHRARRRRDVGLGPHLAAAIRSQVARSGTSV